MTKKLSPPTLASKQKSHILNKGTDNLLRRFLLVRKISLLLFLITIALLLAFILANSFTEPGEFALFALGLLPIAFIIIRLIYRWLKDTNIPLYVITLISILPVAGAIYLDYIVNNDEFFYFIAMIAEISIALNVFALALFSTSLGYLCYQTVIMTKHRRKFSVLMFASTAAAAIIVIFLTVIVVAVMMRVASGDDFYWHRLM